jgi:signal transduction histidine kinase
MEERLRIARDLHDTMGHHLTALALNLEVASHVVEGRAAAHVTTAQALTRTALAELRAVVGATREPSTFDLAAALRALVRAVEAPRIHLELPEGLEALDAERARSVFRCVQEIVTNAQRHANAENLWIDVRSGTEGLRVHATTTGRASPRLAGSGLAGCASVSKRPVALEIASAAGRGFELWAFVPHSRRDR